MEEPHSNPSVLASVENLYISYPNRNSVS